MGSWTFMDIRGIRGYPLIFMDIHGTQQGGHKGNPPTQNIEMDNLPKPWQLPFKSLCTIAK